MNISSDAVRHHVIHTLTTFEGHVLGVLVERQHTVPDIYPFTLSALATGYNQRTAHAPVIPVTEAEVLTAIDGLKTLNLVMEGNSSRMSRFEHNMSRMLGVPSQPVALLTVLLLRGPQTAAELQLNAARFHAFVDISSAEVFPDELAEHDPPYVVRLPHMPGERESRWMHLLCSEVTQADTRQSGDVGKSVAPFEFEALKAEQKQLAGKVARLQALAEQMTGELSISIDKLILQMQPARVRGLEGQSGFSLYTRRDE